MSCRATSFTHAYGNKLACTGFLLVFSSVVADILLSDCRSERCLPSVTLAGSYGKGLQIRMLWSQSASVQSHNSTCNSVSR